MNILLLGSTGTTGRLLLDQLLDRGHRVKAVARDPSGLPEHPSLLVVRGSILSFNVPELESLPEGCDAVACCLGHNMTLKGIFGPPRRLVTEAVRNVCEAILRQKPEKPVKFVLMNTAGNRNRSLVEKYSLAEGMIVGLIRVLLPPQADNEQAAEYLRTEIGQEHPAIAWTAVRPDSLIDTPQVSPYEVFSSPVRSPILDSGCTSRINVAHFMAELVSNEKSWATWQGQMPVIYNAESC